MSNLARKSANAPVMLRYHELQDKLYRTRARFPVVWAGRGSGKTEICRRKVIRHLGMHHPHVLAAGDVPRYFYGLPTIAQAKRVAWDALKNLLPLDWYERNGKTFYESDKIIRSRFGVELHLVGLDAPQRIEGNQWCGGVLDESSDQKPGVFDRTVRPALTAFKGWCIRCGVPKRFGIGGAEFKKACDQALEGIDSDMPAFHWLSESVVDPAELEAIRATVDSRDYNEQYRAKWETLSGGCFHQFNESYNVTESARYDPTQIITVGSDFNVDPMCWTLSHRIGNQLHTFDEIYIRNTNTQETLNYLHRCFPDHSGWTFTGDASAQARKTSATESDLLQIMNDDRFDNKEVRYNTSNPPIVDRLASCNALLRNANDETRAFINPKCTRLISDLESRCFKPGTRELADSGDMGHMSDAWGYVVHNYFPIELEVGTPEIHVEDFV